MLVCFVSFPKDRRRGRTPHISLLHLWGVFLRGVLCNRGTILNHGNMVYNSNGYFFGEPVHRLSFEKFVIFYNGLLISWWNHSVDTVTKFFATGVNC